MRQQMVSRETPPRPGSQHQWALFGDVSHWFITSQRFLIGFKSVKRVSVSGFTDYIIQKLSKLWQHGLDSVFHQQKVWRWVWGHHPSAYEQSQQSVWPSQEIPPPSPVQTSWIMFQGVKRFMCSVWACSPLWRGWVQFWCLRANASWALRRGPTKTCEALWLSVFVTACSDICTTNLLELMI